MGKLLFQIQTIVYRSTYSKDSAWFRQTRVFAAESSLVADAYINLHLKHIEEELISDYQSVESELTFVHDLKLLCNLPEE